MSGEGNTPQAIRKLQPRDAHFVCTLALAWPDEGRIDGTLVWPPRGGQWLWL